jgi:hypothetical protein
MTAASAANRRADPPPLTRCGQRGGVLPPRIRRHRHGGRTDSRGTAAGTASEKLPAGAVAPGQEPASPCRADLRFNLALILVDCKRLNRRSSNNNQRKDDPPRFDTVTWCGKAKRDKGRAMTVT